MQRLETIHNPSSGLAAACWTFVLAACLFLCGCRMVSGVGDATNAIEKSTADIESISQTITNTVPALQEASRILQEAARTIETVTPSLEATVDSLADADRAIMESEQAVEAGTRSIREITGAVDEGTVAIQRLCHTLDTFQVGLDRLPARKGFLVAVISGGATLILVPPLAFLFLLGRFERRLSATADRLAELERHLASGSREGGRP